MSTLSLESEAGIRKDWLGSLRMGEGDTVFRLYHPGLKVHLYTKDKNEYQVLATRGWQQEGTAYPKVLCQFTAFIILA